MLLRILTGLKRTGKSCRLRWLNYLRPDVRRGNITLQEQLLILDLHSRWGNRYFTYQSMFHLYVCVCVCTEMLMNIYLKRWSKIAQELPGRTDNEIKNYWRTRVVKQARQMKCDVNSKQFRDALRLVWIPRMVERIQASSSQTASPCHYYSATSLSDHSMAASGDDKEACSSWNHRLGYSQEFQPFEEGDADLWTYENICFLQQQLADDS